MGHERSGETYAEKKDKPLKYRLVFLSIPTRGMSVTWSLLFWIMLTIGTLIGGLTGVLIASPYGGIDEVPGILFFMMGVVFGALASGWSWIVLHHNRLMRNPAERNERLRQLLRDSTSQTRWPHRVVETVLRSRNPTKKKFRTQVGKIGAGHLVIVTGRGDRRPIRPGSSEVELEPVEICDESEWTFAEHGAIPVDALRSGEVRIAEREECAEESEEPEIEWRPTLRRRLSPISYWVSWVFVALMIYHAWYGSAVAQIALAAWIIVIVRAWTGGFFFERRWWLVPGGLAYREVAAWRRGMRVGLITPEDSTLVLDWRTGDGYVQDGGRGYHFKFGDYAGWAIASTWMSTVRRRTLSEMRSYFGADEA
jgi:hypothetical protein